MSQVLVVDDSAVDRKLAGALLEKSPEIEVRYADSGAAALEMIKADPPNAVLTDLVQRGVIRRFGATLRHQKSGFGANAMTAWLVDEARMDDVGAIMASFKEVSHCYRRDPTPDWKYNLYTMIHGKDEAHCRRTAEKMAAKAGVETYVLLFSRRELKKTSMTYFSTEKS